MVHAYNLSTLEVKVGGYELKASPGYIVIPCLKKYYLRDWRYGSSGIAPA
jgi:hypothetical protein